MLGAKSAYPRFIPGRRQFGMDFILIRLAFQTSSCSWKMLWRDCRPIFNDRRRSARTATPGFAPGRRPARSDATTSRRLECFDTAVIESLGHSALPPRRRHCGRNRDRRPHRSAVALKVVEEGRPVALQPTAVKYAFGNEEPRPTPIGAGMGSPSHSATPRRFQYRRGDGGGATSVFAERSARTLTSANGSHCHTMM